MNYDHVEIKKQTFLIAFYLLFVVSPLCLNVHHCPLKKKKPPLARSDCFITRSSQ